MTSCCYHKVGGGTAKLLGERIDEITCLVCEITLIAYLLESGADTVPIDL
jgi:hypothetical protein